MHLNLPFVLLALAEGLLLLAAPYLAASLVLGVEAAVGLRASGALFSSALIFALFCLGALFAVGLYSTRQRCDVAGIVVRVVTAVTIAVMLSALVYFFFPSTAMSRGTLALAAAIAVLFGMMTRAVFGRVIDENLFKRRVLVFGAGRRAACLSELRRRADTRGFRLLGFIAAEGDEVQVDRERLVERPLNMLQWALRHQVDEIVVAMDDRRLAFPAHELLECRLAGLSIVELSNFLERETGKLRLAVSSPSNIIFSDSFPISGLREGLARAIDILVSLGVLALSVPIIVLTTVAILLEDGWRAPVLYRQRRVGRYGEPFEVLKFRSMGVDAELSGAVWAAPNDPRNTRVGSFIRKTRIDELPQLINVLRGEMSLVGPRPERPEFVAQFEQKLPFYRGRHAVRPGITGWAQLCYPYGANEQDALEKLQYDLYYVKNRSVIFDLAIMMQTVEVVLWQKGAR
jgi:sugar transferase (PEP-CTERM system associated)